VLDQPQAEFVQPLGEGRLDVALKGLLDHFRNSTMALLAPFGRYTLCVNEGNDTHPHPSTYSGRRLK
jgi:hypothetical protein